MAAVAVSCVLPAGGSSIFRHRFSQATPESKIGHCNSPIRRSRQSGLVRAATSTSTKKSVVDDTEVIHVDKDTDYCKGWTDARGMPAQRVLSQFEALSVLVSDRIEMHTILALQRDNWNRLFHTTITMASVSAATASAVNGAAPAMGLNVVAIILGMGAAALMALVSKFQPSQLAEEQRHAARFFKRLGADIDATLEADPRLREHAFCYWEQKVSTMHALDKAFPLPLTPVVVEKFPKQVRPSQLSGELNLSRPEIQASQQECNNGWTSSAEEDLKRTAQLLRTSDIPEYLNMANNAKILNLILSISSPLFATAGVALNMAGSPSVAAAFTIGSLFAHTLTHALQMGAVYEVYRNCAGYYADVEKSIDRVLRLPVQHREHATIFLQKISMLLGRTPAVTPMITHGSKTAGTLF